MSAELLIRWCAPTIARLKTGSIFTCKLHENTAFPHEIGLFLGYPPSDVDGFMHRRDSYKLCGLWKVYDNVGQAVKQFEQYRHCTQILLHRYAQGCPLEELTTAG